MSLRNNRFPNVFFKKNCRSRDAPNYIAFRADGAEIDTDYPTTYNNAMLKASGGKRDT